MSNHSTNPIARSLSAALVISLVATALPLLQTAIARPSPGSPDSATQPATPPTTAPVDLANLPSADELQIRLLNAMGGADKLSAISSTHAVIDVKSPQGHLLWEVQTVHPDRLSWKQTDQGATEEIAYVGTTGWAVNSHGYLEPVASWQLKDMRLYVDLPNVLRNLRSYFKDIKTVDQGEFMNRPSFKLSCTETDGEITIVHIDRETSLCLGFELTRGGPVIFQDTKVVLSDWQDFNGIKMFSTMVHSIDNASPSTLRITSFDHNTLSEEAIAIPQSLSNARAQSAPASQPTVP